MKSAPLVMVVLLLSCCLNQSEGPQPSLSPGSGTPCISSWLSKKDELITSGHPYTLVMTGWVTPEEAAAFRKNAPSVIILAGLTLNWVYDNPEWMTFLETIASAETPHEVTEDMYLKADGKKCAFGWASEEWGHQEIYAMDPRNSEWRALVLAAYKTLLDQPQHDGVIIDMLLDVSWCPDIISDKDWISTTKTLLQDIREMADNHNKLVIVNAGKDFESIDPYAQYIDGYVMENFLGEWGADYETGLEAAQGSYSIVYAVDTDNTGKKDLSKMRLGLTLSLLNDNTYFTYDFGPRDHGQAWWFPEYDVDLGSPLTSYYFEDNAYWREFEKGIVVSCPYGDVTVNFDQEYIDVTTGITGTSFVIKKGDGRIFLKA
jgi:hypothetical protein